jgi:hypothetical protein
VQFEDFFDFLDWLGMETQAALAQGRMIEAEKENAELIIELWQNASWDRRFPRDADDKKQIDFTLSDRFKSKIQMPFREAIIARYVQMQD